MGGVSGGDELCVSQWYYGEEEKRETYGGNTRKFLLVNLSFVRKHKVCLITFLLLHFAIYFFYFLEAECYVWKGGGYLIMCNLFVYFSTKQIQWVSTETLNPNILCLSPPAGVFKAICV